MTRRSSSSAVTDGEYGRVLSPPMRRCPAPLPDRRLQGRVDASDVLQEAYVEALERFADFLQDQPMPFFLWLRFITEQRLQIVHRRHLGTKARDAGRDVSLNHQAFPPVSSESLA